MLQRTIEICLDDRIVVTERADAAWGPLWRCRLYIDKGKTPTAVSSKQTTEKGARKWADWALNNSR
jgi:hypothetical protein